MGRWAAKFLSVLLANALTKARVSKTLVSFVRPLAFYGIVTFIVAEDKRRFIVPNAKITADKITVFP